MVSIIDGNLHAVTLPVAIVLVFGTGTLFVATKARVRVVAGLVRTRAWKASVCIWTPRCKSSGTCPGALASASAAAHHAQTIRFESTVGGANKLPH